MSPDFYRPFYYCTADTARRADTGFEVSPDQHLNPVPQLPAGWGRGTTNTCGPLSNHNNGPRDIGDARHWLARPPTDTKLRHPINRNRKTNTRTAAAVWRVWKCLAGRSKAVFFFFSYVKSLDFLEINYHCVGGRGVNINI